MIGKKQRPRTKKVIAGVLCWVICAAIFFLLPEEGSVAWNNLVQHPWPVLGPALALFFAGIGLMLYW